MRDVLRAQGRCARWVHRGPCGQHKADPRVSCIPLSHQGFERQWAGRGDFGRRRAGQLQSARIQLAGVPDWMWPTQQADGAPNAACQPWFDQSDDWQPTRDWGPKAHESPTSSTHRGTCMWEPASRSSAARCCRTSSGRQAAPPGWPPCPRRGTSSSCRRPGSWTGPSTSSAGGAPTGARSGARPAACTLVSRCHVTSMPVCTPAPAAVAMRSSSRAATCPPMCSAG